MASKIKFYTIHEAAESAGVPYYKIRYLQAVGKLPDVKRHGRLRLYTEEDIARIKEILGSKEGKC